VAPIIAWHAGLMLDLIAPAELAVASTARSADAQLGDPPARH